MPNFCLVGNPNSGKTTLFNVLTGSNQIVGNWPGITVERKEGCIHKGKDRIIDLPGVYSINGDRPDELITRNHLIENKGEIIINVIEGATIERGLFLTLQLLELGRPMMVVVNMMDELGKKGMMIDFDGLSQALGIPVIGVSARHQNKFDEKIRAIRDWQITYKSLSQITYFSQDIKRLLAQMKHLLPESFRLESLFWSLQLLENNEATMQQINFNPDSQSDIHRLLTNLSLNPIVLMAQQRFAYIERLIKTTVTFKKIHSTMSLSEKIDLVVTHPIFAYPIFIAVMSLIFFLAFGPWSTFLTDAFDYGIQHWIALPLNQLMVDSQTLPWVISFFNDAVIGGVGSILSFIPQISLLYFFLAILDETGYISRIAFVLDKLLRKLGMSGKSMVPLIMGFGCTVSAVTTTRAIENSDERKMAILMTPFMSCSAKLPVYVLIAGLFFPQSQGVVVYGLYLLGILVAIIYGLIIRKLFFKKSTSIYLMETPPYRLPYLPNVLKSTWNNLKSFVARAGTLIFLLTVFIWAITSFSWNFQFDQDPQTSFLANFARFVSPVFAPLGFGEWRAVTALIMGLVAKEVVVTTIQTLFTLSAFQSLFTPLSALSFVVFTALYIPCISAMASMAQELKSRKMVIIAILGQLLAAYSVSWLFYQGGSLWQSFF